MNEYFISNFHDSSLLWSNIPCPALPSWKVWTKYLEKVFCKDTSNYLQETNQLGKWLHKQTNKNNVKIVTKSHRRYHTITNKGSEITDELSIYVTPKTMMNHKIFQFNNKLSHKNDHD